MRVHDSDVSICAVSQMGNAEILTKGGVIADDRDLDLAARRSYNTSGVRGCARCGIFSRRLSAASKFPKRDNNGVHAVDFCHLELCHACVIPSIRFASVGDCSLWRVSL